MNYSQKRFAPSKLMSSSSGILAEIQAAVSPRATPFVPAEIPDVFKRMRAEWKQVAHLRVKEHKSIREIALELGFSYQTVLMWTKKPLYIEYEAWLAEGHYSHITETRPGRQEVIQKFDDFAGEMQDRLLTILETTNDQKLAASIAQDWLDRAQHGARRESGKATVQINVTEDKLAEIVKRLRESEAPLEGEVVCQSFSSTPSSEA